MWLLTTVGMFSVVCGSVSKGTRGVRKPVKVTDPAVVMVRARVKAHLELLLAEHKAVTGEASIVENPKADYRFRIIINRAQWRRLAARLVDVTYPNFKDECHKHEDKLGADYLTLLHQLWGMGLRMQERRVRSAADADFQDALFGDAPEKGPDYGTDQDPRIGDADDMDELVTS